MKPHKVLPFGALRHRERPARHNVGRVGVSCCGELRFDIEPSAFPGRDFVIVTRCTECGKPLEVALVEPDLDVFADDEGPWGV